MRWLYHASPRFLDVIPGEVQGRCLNRRRVKVYLLHSRQLFVDGNEVKTGDGKMADSAETSDSA